MNILSLFNFIKAKYNGFNNLRNLFENTERKARIYVDVSEVHIKDGGTGIQRVTNCVLENLSLVQNDYDIVTVFAKRHGAGFYDVKNEKPVRFIKSDIFFGLDFSRFLVPMNKKFLDKLYKNKIPVWFFIHDLIPLTHPELTTEKMPKVFKKWFNTVINYTGLIANSKYTMDCVKEYLEKNNINKNLKLDYTHLGVDFSKFSNVNDTVKVNQNTIPEFLMVATVEPRKKYDQVVKAFNLLWNEGINAKLTIVGRKGWKAENTFKLIEENSEYNKSLFWYKDGISDEELKSLYQKSDAVIMASIVEGFGLAVIEASYFDKYLILRDIPVFREIAGDNAFYFDSFDEKVLADKLKQWLILFSKNELTKSKIKHLTWKECTENIYKILTKM